MTVGVYQILHMASGRVYVGSSAVVPRRVRNHVWYLVRGDHPNTHLQRAWLKYGAAAFEYSVLERCSVDDQLAREQYWIDALRAYDTGFNLTPLAANTRGRKTTAKTRALIGAKSRDANQGTRHPMYGRHHTPETRERISRALKGRKLREYASFSDEHRARLKAAAQQRTHAPFKGGKHSEASRALMRAAWARRRASQDRATDVGDTQ